MSGGKLSEARLGRIDQMMQGCVERGEIAGAVALVGRGDEVYCAAQGATDLAARTPMRRDALFRIASMTKPVTAVAALMLVEETKLRLDEAVDEWLPELANRKVLRSLGSAVDDTVPADRPITVRDLLTFRWGLGAVMALPGTYPIQQAIEEAGVGPGPNPLPFAADEFMRRIGGLPLLHQPGQQWTYHTGSDVLGVLISRVSGQSLGEFLQQRLFGPLGMKDTAFWVPEEKLNRLATSYRRDASSALTVHDAARGGLWSRRPVFEAGGGGLVSTADDYLLFGRMMLAMGRGESGRLLARPTVELMTADHLTAEQKAASPFFPGFWEQSGWGLGVSMTTHRQGIGPGEGSYGWTGGLGTVWCNDPREEMVTIFLMQRMMTAPDDMQIGTDFMTLAYGAIDD